MAPKTNDTINDFMNLRIGDAFQSLSKMGLCQRCQKVPLTFDNCYSTDSKNKLCKECYDTVR